MFSRAYASAGLVVLIFTAACTRPEPITIAENAIVVQNATSRDWTKVMVTVNDHFTGGAPLLAAGGRMNAPLSQFRTGFGQRYDPARQIVYKIEVTATDAKGQPVKLLWGRDKK